ncbi:MAG TPA: NAD-dependent epimerase/dehydratase family protein [Gemmatimonadales bacterium]|nr:NAD-dependent epimerase/dehydratase family protein [Gemmatimonadales bacterium]
MSEVSGSGPWLVTGASGFLGRHLLAAIESSGTSHAPIALVRNPIAWQAMEWTRALPRVRTLTGSVTEPEAWTKDPLLTNLAGIFHLAAMVRHSRREAELVTRTNVEGTLGMVRLAASRGCRLVFVSTSGTVACFRRAEDSADEDSAFRERELSEWPYYRSKLAAEQQARRLADQVGAELVIVRPPVLLGPGDHRFRSSDYVLRFLRGRIPFLIRGGMHFADVRDVARALVRVMELPRAHPIYHLPGTVCSLEEFYGQVATLSGRPAPRFIMPYWPAWLLATLAQRLGLGLLPEPSLIEMASHHWAMRSKYAAAELDYVSRPANETLADTIEWLRANAR